MNKLDDSSWCPFRPTTEDQSRIKSEVGEIGQIQKALLENHPDLHVPDRVAHQYQIAGSKVRLQMAEKLPPALEGIGLFVAGREYLGIGRISSGLGSPHIETNPDFLGLMLAFQTPNHQRVDFLAINDPRSPTANHQDFMHLLHATAQAAGKTLALFGQKGDYNFGNLLAEQKAFLLTLKNRMGWLKAGRTLVHISKQTLRSVRSSTAYQAYWTGVMEAGSTAGKFTLVPVSANNRLPGFRPGERYLSLEWKKRQEADDVWFNLYWVPFLDENRTPMQDLTKAWEEGHKDLVGTLVFPRVQAQSEEAVLFAILAAEMGANPANWIHNRENSIHLPATEFETARKFAYQSSQEGRNALPEQLYASIFQSAEVSAELAQELNRRRDMKARTGHLSSTSFN